MAESKKGNVERLTTPSAGDSAIDALPEPHSEELARARALQSALLQISELSHIAQDMQVFYKRLHKIVCTLMYAENFIIVAVDPQTGEMRFEYFRDVVDVNLGLEQLNATQEGVRASLTGSVVRLGRTLHIDQSEKGDRMQEELAISFLGTDSVDWLGVPLPAEEGPVGALAVQSYDPAIRYGEQEEELLEFVAQHVSVALQRKWAKEALIQAKLELELRVARRTSELETELEIRRRGEKVQATLYRIARLAGEALEMEEFYRGIQEALSDLVYARNIYFAFVDEEAKLLRYPYKVDVAQPAWDDHPIPSRQQPGLTMTVVYSGEPLLYIDDGENMPPGTTGARPVAWLGAPLKIDDQTVGAVAVQSYDPNESYTEQDRELLTFVARQVSTTIQRQRDKMALQEAHAELERRVQSRTAELRAAMGRLVTTQTQLAESEKMASLGNLVAGIAHDINTPLGVAVTAASQAEKQLVTLKEQLQDDEALNRAASNAHFATEMVVSNLERARKLVGSFKQVAADQSTGDRRQFDIGQYLQEILSSLDPNIKRSGHHIELNCPELVVIDGYPSALYQIISNLVMNSLIHAFQDGETGHMTIDVTPDQDEVLLIYRDSGRGLTVEETQHLYEPFFTTRRGRGGTGLGMNIVFNNVTHMGGTIEAMSEPEKGVRFDITLPRVAREMHAGAAPRIS